MFQELKEYIKYESQCNQYFMLTNSKEDYVLFNQCMGQYFYLDKVEDTYEAILEYLNKKGEVIEVSYLNPEKTKIRFTLRDAETDKTFSYFLFAFDEKIIEV